MKGGNPSNKGSAEDETRKLQMPKMKKGKEKRRRRRRKMKKMKLRGGRSQ